MKGVRVRVCYTVIASLPDAAVAGEYVAWLRAGHVAAVLAGGAESAMVVRLDSAVGGDVARVMTQYVFPSREALERYERDAAPRLREEGRRMFGDRGVTFVRSFGEVIEELRSPTGKRNIE